ncbi:MAG: GntR family transcriptional regulator, partial [bacterium]
MYNETLQQRAYQYIQKQILSGDLAFGSQLSELSLAREIGISRTPVREAITQLQFEGYLERVPRYGTIVRTPDRNEIVELYEMREALESYAASLAAQRVGENDLHRLRQFCDEIYITGKRLRASGMKALDSEMMKRFRTADMGFHILLLQAAGNRRVMKQAVDSHVLSRLFCHMYVEET